MQNAFANPKSLQPNPWNTNVVGPENMKKLKRSISDLGFVSAVVVRELADGSLQILGGHHRVEAAVELGIPEVPILNIGRVPDAKAKKIGLVDNSRYGTDDTINLAKLLEEIGASSSDMAEILPWTEADFDTVRRSVEIDLDSLEMMVDDDDDRPDPEDVRPSKPAKTHEVVRFRLSLGDAERIRQLIEKTIKREGLHEEDDMTAAGSALAVLLLRKGEDSE